MKKKMSRREMLQTMVMGAAGIALVSCTPATPPTPTVSSTNTAAAPTVSSTNTAAAPTVSSTNTAVPQPTTASIKEGLVEFSGFYPKDTPEAQHILEAGAQLEKDFPQCTFKYSEYVGEPGNQAVILRIEEGDPLDIFNGGSQSGTSGFMNGGGDLFKAGYVYDLTPDMAKPAYGETTGTWWDSFTGGAQSGMRIGTTGPIICAGVELTSYVLWYNTALYQKYNLKEPKTWEDLMGNSKVLKENGIASIGGGGASVYISNWYEMLLYRLVGDDKFTKLMFDSDPGVKWTDPEPVKAAQMLADMVKNGYATPGFVGGDYSANQIIYFTAQAAHIFIGTWLMGEMKASVPTGFQQAVTYFPTVTGYESVTPYETSYGNLNYFSVFNPGKNAKEVHSTEGAVQFMKILTSKEYETKAVTELDGFVPAVKGVPGPSNIPGITDVLANMKNWFPSEKGLGVNYPDAYNKLADNVVNLVSFKLTPEQFGSQMQKDWDTTFKK